MGDLCRRPGMSGIRVAVALAGERVHGREVLSAVAVTVFTGLVQKGAVSVMTLFIAEERRAVLRCAKLRPTTVSLVSGAVEMVSAYLRTRSPLGDPSTAAMQVAASALVA